MSPQRFNVHGVPWVTGELVDADPEVMVTLRADDDEAAERLANMLCGMDVSAIDCAECSSPADQCLCDAGGPAAA